MPPGSVNVPRWSAPTTGDAAGHVWAWLCGNRNEAIVLVAITALAAFLRVYQLGSLPAGMHVDEANTGLRSQGILNREWAGPYDPFHGAGQPAGTEFWTAGFIALFGNSLFVIRLSIAVLGIATVPLAYLLFRMIDGRLTAAIGSTFIALSSWDIMFSRTAWPPIAATTTAVLAALLLLLALRRRTWWLFPIAGVGLALGIYVYNGYTYFLPAAAAVLGGWLIAERRALRAAATKVGLLLASFFIVAQPMLSFIRAHQDIYVGRGRNELVFSSERYHEASGLLDRADVILDSGRQFVTTVVFQPVYDMPMLAPAISVLLGIGFLYAVLRWREPGIALALLGFLIIPWAGILSPGSSGDALRRSVAVTPFVYLLAALPLGAALRSRWLSPAPFRALAVLAVAAAVVSTGVINTTFYFRDYANSDGSRYLLSLPLQAASEYMTDLPDGTYVYFYSGRWSFDAPVRAYLAPHIVGEDRSGIWGPKSGLVPDQSRDVAYVFLDRFTDLPEVVAQLYPGGESTDEYDRDGTPFFRAYFLHRATFSSSP